MKIFYRRDIILALTLFFSLTAPIGAAEVDKDWLVAKYKALDLAINKGEGFSQTTNERGNLAWAQSYLLEAYLDMYQGTGDKTWIDTFLRQTQRIIKATDKDRGLKDYLGRTLSGWGNLSYSKPYGWKPGDKADLGLNNKPRVLFWSHNAMIVYPLVKFALMVKRDPKLSVYSSQIEPLTEAAKKTISLFNDQWRYDRSTGEGYFVFEKNMPIYGNIEDCENCRSSLNSDLAVGRVMAGLCLLQIQGDYCQKARALAKKFKHNLILSDNRYTWHYRYQEDRHLSDIIEDLSHGAIDVAFAYECYQAGIEFTREDMQKFANTLLSTQRNRAFAKFVDGSGDDPEFNFSDAAGRWLDLSTIDCRIYPPVFSYLTQRVSDRKTYHPQVLLGIAKLVKYYDTCRGQ